MENCQLILNSNSLCVICLREVKAKLSKADLFPLHHLTSKINSNLGDVFKDVTVPWARNAVLDRLEVLADVCEGCTDLCEGLLYEFQDDVGRENCVKAILDKMGEAGLEDKYLNCGSPAAVFYAGIVDRLRKDIVEKLHLKPELGERSNQSATGTPAGLQAIPNLLSIPDLPMSQICSYLCFNDIRNCSTVNKGLRRLVFPSLIDSSFISFKNQSQIPTMIDFIKAIANNFKKNINLFVDSDSLNDDDFVGDSRATLLQLFQECGRHINYLKLYYECYGSEYEVASGLWRNIIPVRPSVSGNEVFPNLKGLEIYYDFKTSAYFVEKELGAKCRQYLINGFSSFVKALLHNSPTLREVKMFDYNEEVVAPSLYKLIGESGLPIDTLEIDGMFGIMGNELNHLQPLNLKKVVLEGIFVEGEQQRLTLTNFLESQSSTLKHFSLQEACWNPLPHFTCPRMEVLETFKLFNEDPNEDEGFGPIAYRTQLTKLKQLEVEIFRDDYLPTLFPTDGLSNSVHELRLLLPTLQKHILVMATGVYSCLSKLEIPVASYLKDLWKDLSGLEELTLRPKAIETYENASEHSQEKITWIDEIITGLPLADSDCEGVRDIRSHQEKYEEMETKKSLALLTRLKLLRIRTWVPYPRRPNLLLSDICCKVVLIKMESLKSIDFCGAHPSSVGASRNVLDEMGRKMDLFFGKERERPWNS